MHATIPKGNMGYDQYTVPDTVAVEVTFAASLGLANGLSWHSFKFLRRTMNSKPPTISFGIVAYSFSRPTTFLEIAVFFRRIFLQPDYRTLINSDL